MFLATHGILSGSAEVIPYSNTKSIELDGLSDYVDIGNPNNLSTITSISISAWFKTTDTAGGLVIVGSDDQSQGRRYALRTHSSNGIKLRFISFPSNSSFNDIVGTTNINDGQWHHVMAINNGTNLKIYIDGVLDNINTNGHLINTSFATPEINIGRRSYSGFEGYFDGSIDEVAIWSSDQSANASAIGGTVPTDLSTYNPLGWWRCGDNDVSPILTDNGSGGNDGTMTNFSTFITDVPQFNNYSIELDGLSDYVDCGNDSSLQPSNFTICLWVKTDNNNSNRTLIHNGAGNFGSSSSGFLVQQSFGNYYFRIGNGTANTTVFNGGLIVDTWQFLTLSYDGVNMRSYLDGILQDTASVSNITYGTNATWNTFYIGRTSGGSQYFSGLVDEVSLFNSALSQSDITAIYGSGVPTSLSSYSSLVSWWRFEGTGTTATDSGSGGNNGTLINGVTRSTGVPT